MAIATIDQMKPIMEKFEHYLVENDRSHVSEINDIYDHIITSGGKRLRPLLLLTFAKMLNFSESHLHLACAVEMLHTATLLHDDVIDKSELRRGLPTANVTYGVPASILLGDYLYTKAFKLLLNYGNDAISHTLVDVVQLMSEGEMKQLFRSHGINFSEDNYYQVIEAKTSCLFELACELAALTEYGRSDKFTSACKDFGFHFGNAFQITDDIIDYRSDKSTMGKTPGDDFAEGKITLPLIHLYRSCNASDQKWLEDLLSLEGQGSDTTRRDNFSRIVEMMQSYGCFDYCVEVAKREIESAKQALIVFDDSVFKDSLLTVVDQIISRKL